MSQPKPIKVRGRGGQRIKLIRIKPIGFKSQPLLYLVVESDYDYVYGFIEDRDVKRLMAWCKDCLRNRKK